MLTLNLDDAEDLAEAFYLALVSVDEFDGRLGRKRWRATKPKDRDRWVRAAARLIRLYPAEGFSLGPIGEAHP